MFYKGSGVPSNLLFQGGRMYYTQIVIGTNCQLGENRLWHNIYFLVALFFPSSMTLALIVRLIWYSLTRFLVKECNTWQDCLLQSCFDVDVIFSPKFPKSLCYVEIWACHGNSLHHMWPSSGVLFISKLQTLLTLAMWMDTLKYISLH